MKKFLMAVIGGGLLGAVLVAWFSPTLISWYFEPPVDFGVNCRPAVDWGLNVYRKSMLIGGGLGAIIGGLLILAFRERKRTSPPSSHL